MLLRVVAEDATPPPAPWRDSEIMSQLMKKRVYQIGFMREIPSPWTTTLRFIRDVVDVSWDEDLHSRETEIYSS